MTFAAHRINCARRTLDTARYWLREAAKSGHDPEWQAYCAMQVKRYTDKAELHVAAADQLQDRRAA